MKEVWVLGLVKAIISISQLDSGLRSVSSSLAISLPYTDLSFLQVTELWIDGLTCVSQNGTAVGARGFPSPHLEYDDNSTVHPFQNSNSLNSLRSSSPNITKDIKEVWKHPKSLDFCLDIFTQDNRLSVWASKPVWRHTLYIPPQRNIRPEWLGVEDHFPEWHRFRKQLVSIFISAMAASSVTLPHWAQETAHFTQVWMEDQLTSAFV